MTRFEQMSVCASFVDPRLENRLGFGADRNEPLLAVMLGFVRGWRIVPNRTSLINVLDAHLDDFARPHPRQSLKFDHCPYLRRYIRFDGIDIRLGYGMDRFGLAGGASTCAESGNGL